MNDSAVSFSEDSSDDGLSADSYAEYVAANPLPEVGVGSGDNVASNGFNSQAHTQFLNANQSVANTEFRMLQGGFTINQEGNFPETTNVTRDSDHFLFVQHFLTEDGVARGEQFIFSTVGLSDSRELVNSGVRVDRFFLSAALTADGPWLDAFNLGSEWLSEGHRPFLRDASIPNNVDLLGTGLLAVNSASDDVPFVYADFGLAGAGVGQASTLSVTLGSINYGSEFSLRGNTVGSSLSSSENAAPVSIESPVGSTSFGGGETAAGFSNDGYASYITIENFTPDPGDILNGDVENEVVGGETSYSSFTLATGISSESLVNRSSQQLTGFFAAASVSNNATYSFLGLDQERDTLSVDANADTNTVTVGFGDSGITVGGSGSSAYIDEDRFAAGNQDVAVVTSQLLTSGLADGASVPTELAPTYEHTQWGFFLGDMNPDGDIVDHVHMGTWVAGDTTGTLAALEGRREGGGVATYEGHAIGTVVDNGSQHTAVGTYANTWNFSTNTGNVELNNFDGGNYNGTTVLNDGAITFTGDVANSSGNVQGGLSGSFYGPNAQELGGNFFLSGENYGAVGTFAASEK